MNKQNENEEVPGLQHWQVKAPLPPRFQENVWRRIEASQAQKSVPFWQEWLNGYRFLTARPAWAVAYATVFLLAGSAVGLLHGRQTTARFNDQLENRYVQSLDPYQPRE